MSGEPRVGPNVPGSDAPSPDVLDELGWTGGESITDCRTFVHYFRTTNDGRIVFGWGGGPFAFGARLGRRVVLLEIGAREAMSAPAIEATARDAFAAAAARGHPRAAQVRALIEAADEDFKPHLFVSALGGLLVGAALIAASRAAIAARVAASAAATFLASK